MSEGSSKSNLFEKLAPVLVVLSIALAFLVGMLWQKVQNLEKGGTTPTTQTAAAPAATVDLATIKGLWDKNLIKFGDKNSKLLFVEIADPSCPYCHVAGGFDPTIAASMDTQTNRFKYVSQGGKYQPPVPEIKKLIDSGKASYVYIFFPGHGSGEMGMKSLICANDQGKFWEAHELIMSKAGYDLMNNKIKNDKTQSEAMASFLKNVVDLKSFKSCLNSGKYDDRIAADTAIAQDLSKYFGQYFGTPAFFVNTNTFGGAYSWTDMKSVVDAALK